jgi:gluconate 2-dehydrogenase gamma chain
MDRRRFLEAAAGTMAAAPIAACASRPGGRFSLSAAEVQTLAALCDRIVPPDQDPGAVWAGAVDFIDRHLARALKRHLGAYREGLAALDATSAALRGRPFAELSADEQDGVLTRVEKDEVPAEIWTGVSAPEFFGLVVDHTLASYYGDPRHGGNRDGSSWRMLGIPHPPLRAPHTPPPPWCGGTRPTA